MDKELLVEFGKRIKALREVKGLKQREMAEIMGLTLRHYQRFEYGEVNTPITVLNFFADYFGVTADYLLGRDKR
ncbi:XRE family transcriptional regulator [Pseudoflavonifractor sp. 60]|uniref:helix-turn-helix domain-containing protein n=1 Tax=Pseudoflavonifractor sp. 60 TaxID=2304576 RepID=UPI001367E502|nr:helix-turn-helix transcriptional regulator [Pseudoflavonifractor sp. 60]NBI66880.1 XRE family transcriptional regulator [Pseudoflavonifractor sp. 60]